MFLFPLFLETDQKRYCCDLCQARQPVDSMQSLSNYQWNFYRTRTKNLKICMETQKTLDSQSNLEKEKWSWENQVP